MVEGIRGEGYNFAEICGKAQEACEKRFVTGATEAKLEDTDWVWEDELELLREEISSVSDHFRADETKKMINSIEVGGFITFCGEDRLKGLLFSFPKAQFQETDFRTCRIAPQFRFGRHVGQGAYSLYSDS